MYQKKNLNKIESKSYEYHIERWWYLNFAVLFYILHYLEGSIYWLLASIGIIGLFLLSYFLEIKEIIKIRRNKNGK